MLVNVGVSLSFLIILAIIIIVFSLKEKLNTIENFFFKKLVVVTALGLILEVLIYIIAVYKSDSLINFLNFLIKVLYVYYVIWMYYFILYGFCTFFDIKDSNNLKYIKFKKIINTFSGISLILSVILPFTLQITDNFIYPHGIGTNAQYIIVTMGMNIIAICGFMNFKKLKNKESIPFIACMFLGGASCVIQILHHEFLFIIPSHAIAIILMYFTIENPDIKMLKEVAIAKTEAEQANKAKTDFLSSMSHEIRTPLNAIVGFSSVIENADNLEEAKENAKDIVEASNTLLEIVNGILDISKIEAGKLELINKDYNTYDLYEGAGKLISIKMQEKGLDFQVNIAKDMPKYLNGDAANIKKILVNLLSNAYKYTDKGTVKYSINSVKNDDVCRLIITVEDTGRGIKKESIDKLFTKFQRLDEDRNTTIEGTGLGLAITKQLIEMMGGKIIVQSEFGVGSKFIVVLDQKLVDENAIKEETSYNMEVVLDLSNKRIMIVDDNALNLKVSERLMRDYNPNLDLVDSGFACLDKINAGEKYDLILLDDMMPKLSGTETLEKLKAINGFNTPVIALTANAISGMREQYLAKGFNDYLAKPIERPELIRVFKKYLTNNEEEIKEEKDIKPIPVTIPSDTYDIEYLKSNGFDVDTAISLLGDETIYHDTIEDFYNGTKERVLKLNTYLQNKDMASYAIDIHALKSDAKYIGLTKLADIALNEEMKSKDNDYEYVKSDFNNLMIELKRVIVIIKKYLNKK